LHVITVKTRGINGSCKDIIVAGKSEEKSLSSSNSSKKDIEEREETKRRILEDTLEFMLSLPKERKIPKVTELETVHATTQQQTEMERLLKE
jgi:hypothetical protein